MLHFDDRAVAGAATEAGEIVQALAIDVIAGDDIRGDLFGFASAMRA
jgi:hypothetical protein